MQINNKKPITMKVTLLIYNWHECGERKDSWGEDWKHARVSEHGVISIEENLGNTNMPLNYLIRYEDGRAIRVFNPNTVHYEI